MQLRSERQCAKVLAEHWSRICFRPLLEDSGRTSSPRFGFLSFSRG
jgi:hypothetical protein